MAHQLSLIREQPVGLPGLNTHSLPNAAAYAEPCSHSSHGTGVFVILNGPEKMLDVSASFITTRMHSGGEDGGSPGLWRGHQDALWILIKCRLAGRHKIEL